MGKILPLAKFDYLHSLLLVWDCAHARISLSSQELTELQPRHSSRTISWNAFPYPDSLLTPSSCSTLSSLWETPSFLLHRIRRAAPPVQSRNPVDYRFSLSLAFALSFSVCGTSVGGFESGRGGDPMIPSRSPTNIFSILLFIRFRMCWSMCVCFCLFWVSIVVVVSWLTFVCFKSNFHSLALRFLFSFHF